MPMRREQVAAALRYLGDKADLRRRAERMVSLDPQEQDLADIAVETGASFVPGVGQALAARDVERARRANDPAGMAMAAAGAIPGGKLAKLLKGFDPTRLELDVYHGTPHRFPATEANPLGEFDASKIGTGEGAQAYGHGVYLAESPAVAQGYRDALSKNVTVDGAKLQSHPSDSPLAQAHNMTVRNIQNGMTPDAAIAATQKYWIDAANEMSAFTKNHPELADRIAKEALGNRQIAEAAATLKPESFYRDPGALYKADLPDEMIDRMLDWDKPLSEQPWIMKRITPLLEDSGISKDLIPKLTGKDVMSTDGPMAAWFGVHRTQKMYAEGLRQEGIPGIKYLDAGSRGQGGSGTRNFVVFPGEEKKVRILERK